MTPDLNRLLIALNNECLDHFNWSDVKNRYAVEYFSLYLTCQNFILCVFFKNIFNTVLLKLNLYSQKGTQLFQAPDTFTCTNRIILVYSFLLVLITAWHNFIHSLITITKKNISDANWINRIESPKYVIYTTDNHTEMRKKPTQYRKALYNTRKYQRSN